MSTAENNWIAFDRQHLWHPYAAMNSELPVYPVVAAAGVRLRLADGRELIDGMASWWSAIHGYNVPELNAAAHAQLEQMAHVMFGGLTHPAAAELGRLLVEISPAPLRHVFFSDSGSVAVEVAIKMALQYWYAQGRGEKHRLLTIRNGYHGDTFGAMAVCDPETGMHGIWSGLLPQHLFAAAPQCRSDEEWHEQDIASLQQLIEGHHQELAAVILEPIVQGAGGMRFYAPEYLRRVRSLCDQYDLLLIADEIATGFGRTGKLFACEHAGISPDILCLGKALTGGYLSLAATLATTQVAATLSSGEPGVFMHGPTFMANPLACAIAAASVQLLLDSPWQERIAKLEAGLKQGLEPCRALPQVAEVRVLGGIGVVELRQPVAMAEIQPAFVAAGVWVRPFGKLVYVMPAYIISASDLAVLTGAICQVVAGIEHTPGKGPPR